MTQILRLVIEGRSECGYSKHCAPDYEDQFIALLPSPWVEPERGVVYTRVLRRQRLINQPVGSQPFDLPCTYRTPIVLLPYSYCSLIVHLPSIYRTLCSVLSPSLRPKGTANKRTQTRPGPVRRPEACLPFASPSVDPRPRSRTRYPSRSRYHDQCSRSAEPQRPWTRPFYRPRPCSSR